MIYRDKSTEGYIRYGFLLSLVIMLKMNWLAHFQVRYSRGGGVRRRYKVMSWEKLFNIQREVLGQITEATEHSSLGLHSGILFTE